MVTNLQIDKKNIKRETEIKTVIPISFYEEAFTLFIEDCAFFDSSMLGTKRVKIYFENFLFQHFYFFSKISRINKCTSHFFI